MSEPSGQPDGVIINYGRARMVSAGADVNILFGSYVTRVTGYNLPVNLTLDTPDNGKVKKIYNDTGGNIVINSSIDVQGAATDTLTLASGGFVELIYLKDPDITERWREIDQVGLTLS